MCHAILLLSLIILSAVLYLLPTGAGEEVDGITGLTLIDAYADIPLGPLVVGTTIDIAETGPYLTIRAETTGATRRVKFDYDHDDATRLDNRPPFTLGYEKHATDDGTVEYIAVPSLATAGTHRVKATAIDFSGRVIGTFEVTFDVLAVDYGESPAPPATSIFIDSRINDHLSQVTIEGRTWLYNPRIPMAETAPYSEALFEMHRSGPAFAYIITGFAPNASHTVTIGFAENYDANCGTGKRIFDILVNKEAFEIGLDVYGRVGGCYIALVETHTFLADPDGSFVIDFLPVVENPMVSFIAIEKTAEGTASEEPVPSRSPSAEPIAETNSPSATPTDGPTFQPGETPLTVPEEEGIDEPSRAPTDTAPATLFGIYNHSPSGALTGELRKWHKITLGFEGPELSENDDVNPFTDYRLDVTFIHVNKEYVVPGYYAATGDAAQSSADSGSVWLVHFSPDEVGIWNWTATFVKGNSIAQTNSGGVTADYFDGETGAFIIEETNKSGRDLRGKGRLRYVGEHHLQFAETGEWFLKAGADSPENFLAYEDFDNTPNNGGWRKSWEPHKRDFKDGDPTWQGGKGTGIIGALNYLSDQGMNAFSFIPMTTQGGDDGNVFPSINDDDPLAFSRMDCSKLAQWEIVFEHADHLGLNLHFKTQEHENDQFLDGGKLGNERKLYYRELIARFSHHLAVTWNLGEETTNTDKQREDFAAFIRSTDPYDHLIVVHTYPREKELVYTPLLGFDALDGVSMQCKPWKAHEDVLEWVERSAAAGRKWVVANDEQNSAAEGVLPDSVDANHDSVRRDFLWGTIMAVSTKSIVFCDMLPVRSPIVVDADN